MYVGGMILYRTEPHSAPPNVYHLFTTRTLGSTVQESLSENPPTYQSINQSSSINQSIIDCVTKAEYNWAERPHPEPTHSFSLFGFQFESTGLSVPFAMATAAATARHPDSRAICLRFELSCSLQPECLLVLFAIAAE